MTKIIWSCSHCGTVLPLWQVICSNCHRAALSWLHVIVLAVVVLPAILLLIKFL